MSSPFISCPAPSILLHWCWSTNGKHGKLTFGIPSDRMQDNCYKPFILFSRPFLGSPLAHKCGYRSCSQQSALVICFRQRCKRRRQEEIFKNRERRWKFHPRSTMPRIKKLSLASAQDKLVFSRLVFTSWPCMLDQRTSRCWKRPTCGQAQVRL